MQWQFGQALNLLVSQPKSYVTQQLHTRMFQCINGAVEPGWKKAEAQNGPNEHLAAVPAVASSLPSVYVETNPTSVKVSRVCMTAWWSGAGGGIDTHNPEKLNNKK
jgi:hypothetical protein